MRNLACAVVLGTGCVVGAAGAIAQAPASAPAFEVASIREDPSPEQVRESLLAGTLRPQMIVTESRVSITYLPLGEILRRAFQVERYQMDAPEWTEQARFDIQAAIPAGVGRDQVPRMLQRLLVERFGLTFRREPRPLEVYALVVGSGGAKLPASKPGAAAEALAGAQGGNQTASTLTLKSERSNAVTFFEMGSDRDTVRLRVIGMSMPELAYNLSGFLDRPVADRTGLEGTYDFALELPPPWGTPGSAVVPPSPGAAPGTPADSASAPLSVRGGVIRAVERLGLALEPRREPIEVVVVERIERTATPN